MIRYIHPTHYGWVQDVKATFPTAEINEDFLYTNSYIEIIVEKSESCKLALKLSFVGDENNLAENGHISCICGPITGIRQKCVLDVSGWRQAISDFKTITQQVDGSATYQTVNKLFDDLKKSKSVA